MRYVLLIICAFLFLDLYGQRCEKLRKDYFYFLPELVPSEINCVDQLGQKHGLWIDFEVIHQLERTQDLDTGLFVARYTYGYYEGNRKIGDWNVIEYVHQIYPTQRDSFYYNGDTSVIVSYEHPGLEATRTYRDKQNRLIYFQHWNEGTKVIIRCDPSSSKLPECVIEYKRKIIKTFPLDQVEFEIDRVKLGCYQREQKLIDQLED